MSIYLPTELMAGAEPVGSIELKNLAADATGQLSGADLARGELDELAEVFEDLIEDEEFWEQQGRSLAVFATPGGAQTFRLPNRLERLVEVSDRFHVKPLLRAVTFPQAAFVLALSQNDARLVEVAAETPATAVRVPGMPRNAASAAGKSSLGDRSADRRIQGSEGKKVRLRQYARKVAAALRPQLAGMDLPLILAATQPLESIYRAVNTYPHLAGAMIGGNPDELSDAELGEASRSVLDGLYAKELADLRDLYDQRAQQARASDDLEAIARAATFGAVDTLFVDIDSVIPGVVDDESGAVTLADSDDSANYGVGDEIARRVLDHRGRVLALRQQDVPGGGQIAAILRYAV